MTYRRLLMMTTTLILFSVCTKTFATLPGRSNAKKKPIKDPVYRAEIKKLFTGDQKILDAHYFSMAQKLKITGQYMHYEGHILKRLIKHYGWPTYSLVGKGASNAAFVLILHQDADVSFQKRALKETRPLVYSGEMSRYWYSYLYDRVMIHEGNQQVFGTQGHCIATGKDAQWEPFPIRGYKNLDKRRKRLGLKPESSYIKTNTSLLCRHPLHSMH